MLGQVFLYLVVADNAIIAKQLANIVIVRPIIQVPVEIIRPIIIIVPVIVVPVIVHNDELHKAHGQPVLIGELSHFLAADDRANGIALALHGLGIVIAGA